jgi:hypothetical protein
MEILARLLLEEPRPIADVVPGVPPRLAALVGALLAKDASHRVADAVIVREELAAIRAALAAGDAPALHASGPRIPQRVALHDGAPTVDVRPPRKSAPSSGARDPSGSRDPRGDQMGPASPRRRTGLLVGAVLGGLTLVGVVLVLVFVRSDRKAPAASAEATAVAPVASPAVAAPDPAPDAVPANAVNDAPPCSKDVSTGCAARCDAGDGEACYHDGLAIFLGRDGRASDHAAAIPQLVRGCELGFDAACASGGSKLFDLVKDGAWSREKGHAEAVRLLELGCKRGYLNACSRLGLEYIPPKGKLPPDLDRAFDVLGPSCAKFDYGNCLYLKRALDAQGGTPAARERAASIMSDACRTIPRLKCKP